MEIECPNCGARYQVTPQSIGQDGRKVRCARCHTSWHQTLDDVAPPRREPEPEPRRPPARPRPRAVPDPQPAASPTPPPPKAAPRPKPKPVPPPEPSIPPPPTHDDPPQSATNALQDLVDDSDPAPQGRDEWRPDLGGDRGLPGARQGLVGTGRKRSGGRSASTNKGGRSAVVAILLLMLLPIGILAYTARQQIVEMAPFTGTVYRAVGLVIEEPAELPPGDPNQVFSLPETQNQVTGSSETGFVLTVQGVILNSSEQRWRLPPVQVTLFGDDGEQIDTVFVTAEAEALAPGEQTNFVAEFENPMFRQGRIEVLLVPPADDPETDGNG